MSTGASGGCSVGAMSTTTALRNFIDGEFVEAASTESDAIVNPATGETLAESPRSSQEDVDRAVAAAAKAFETWGATTPADRQLALLKLADVLESHGDEIAELEARNAGKPLQAVKDDEISSLRRRKPS